MSGMKILLVDDDQVDRALVKRILNKSQLSVQVVEAETVDEGLSAFELQAFDVVLLDYRMPQRDGIEMLIELRNSFSDHSVAIIVMSHLEDEQTAINCIKEGAQDYIVKSEISVSKLRSAILHSQIKHELESKLLISHINAKKLAETDSLTGIGNRYVFDEQLNSAISIHAVKSESLAVLVLDIDNFRFINDTHGHHIGDDFLAYTAKTIQGCLSEDAYLARLGGDEFGIIVSHVKHLKQVSNIAINILKGFKQPSSINGVDVLATVSMGVSIFPDNSEYPADLFKQAELAMYRSKKRGRNKVCYFEDKMQQSFNNRYTLEQNMAVGIRDQEFVLHFQPVVTRHQGSEEFSIKGFESLIRWQRGDELLLPDDFVSVAEDSGQITEIGRWVFEQSIKYIKADKVAANS